MLFRFVSRNLHHHLSFLALPALLVSSRQTLSLTTGFSLASSANLFLSRHTNLVPAFLNFSSRPSSTTDGDGGSWKITPESDVPDALFGVESSSVSALAEGEEAFSLDPEAGIGGAGDGFGVKTFDRSDREVDIFEDIDKEEKKGTGNGFVVKDEWETVEGYKPWTFGDDETSVFDVGEKGGIEGIQDGGFRETENETTEERLRLEKREEELLATLKGPNRAFGDLIAASGITEDMIDSLILLKDVRGVKGLPPLSEIEDKAIARMNTTSTRAEIERKKQEEISKARVRTVDEKGRAYGTGRRKCSIARVWIQPGDGKFIVNGKQFDTYFPVIDQRAVLLGPFTATKTLGLWDVKCTVKGGGVSGQVGAIRLGISRALQNWEPGLRPYLKSAGYLSRDARVVERKKPGKAKARKSFQWVKR